MPETQHISTMGDGGPGGGSLQANQVLQARYKILAKLGGGGMGTVYQARDLRFPGAKRLVAIKEMLNTASNPSLRENALKIFEREANILATLSHPAIPKIFDFFSTNDRAYLVMEFINGNDVEELLAKTKELPVEKIVEWAIDLCDVLDYLHNQQPQSIIFRDMKPSNVMIDSLGKIRLIDFGIARTFAPNTKVTMIGTEGYSAPEQYKGNATAQSDIYSLGATLHHILTRNDPRMAPPFSFEERPIKEFNPQAPERLTSIVEKALAFEAVNRYATCAEMKAELMALRGQATVSGRREDAGGTETQFFGTDDAVSGIIEPKWVFKTEDEIRCSPTAYRNFAYVGSYDTNMWAVDMESGEMVWKFATGGGIASSPVVDPENKLVLFGSEDHKFYAVDYRRGAARGEYPAWTYETGGRIRSSARVALGHVFFGSDDGNVYALGMTGNLQWKYELGAPVRSSPYISESDQLVVVGSEEGELVAITLRGDKAWGARTGKAISSSPYIDASQGLCYVGSNDHKLYAFDVQGGYPAWTFRSKGPIIASPVVHGGMVYIASADGTLYAIDPQTRRAKWTFEIDDTIVSSPVIHTNFIYFGGADGNIYAIELKSGKERWKFNTGGPITSTPFITNDTLLVGSMNYNFYALPLFE